MLGNVEDFNKLFESLGSDFRIQPHDPMQEAFYHFLDLLIKRLDALEGRLKCGC